MYYLKQLPVQLVISILLAFALGHFLDVFVVSIFYSISSSFIEILIFALPIMVFSFIFRALVNSKRGSLLLLLLIFGGVTFSNCLALVTSYFFGWTFLPFLGLSHSPDLVTKFASQVPLLFKLDLPKIIGTDKAMAIGLVSGVAVSFFKEGNRFKSVAQNFANRFSDAIIVFLQKVFLPLLPLYVFGFCLKLSYDNAMVHLFQQFGKVFLLSLSLVAIYIYTLYFIGSGFDFRKTHANIRAMLPAGLTGFSTMSSAATMPVTLTCTEKNTNDRDFTDLIIPATTNIHMLGDDLTLVIVAMSLLSIFGMPWPDMLMFMPFVMAFSLAKLSCVGVPGASVLVVLPVFQHQLGFTAEMVSVLTTIYILQDSFGTASNVMGNGAFALIIQRIFYRKKLEEQVAEPIA
jgi:Na+/H+-dicarboxylate symporter